MLKKTTNGRLVHTTSVDTRSAEGELVEGTTKTVEVEALIVVVLVGVGRATGGASVLDVSASSVAGSGDLAGRVAGAAAGGGTSGLEGSWGSSGGGHEGEEGEELHGCLDRLVLRLVVFRCCNY